MVEKMQANERLFLSVSDGGEHRQVTALEGESLAVMEVTSGPDTQVAYGTPRRGHKILCEHAACARVLGVEVDGLAEALAAYFGQAEEPVLSDLMDRFDVAGERYTYTAWGDGGDMAFRPAAE